MEVVLRCYGLSSVEPVNRRAIRPVDEERCVIGEGRAISRGTPVRFRYAWMTLQDFPLQNCNKNRVGELESKLWICF
ncbi:hypothetical protein ZIOFF_058574 [Zingiber officinale]|uniref:Uncharacterized protein n=1 Tax=Zingiber officinale TaxID=94328 RepID=A0A8J5KAV8_ZINOF|nr:hypothetical protein ZIOFF_058574 [Zingiber officinale]